MPLPGPDTRVVELRVHGILGTTPEDLVGSVAAVDVAGDGVGRIVRPADRLNRPAPGPALQAAGRSTPRTIEGYVWSGMTSGGWSKAIWALLFPFSLANVAYWMLPPIPDGSRTARVLGLLCRALLRLAALLLTVLLIGQLSVVSVDLLATQCLRPGSGCLAVVSDSARRVDYLRSIIGVAPVALAVLVLHRVSTVDWKVRDRLPDRLALAQPSRQMPHIPHLPGEFVAADPDTPALRSLHVLASLATIALLSVGARVTNEPGRAAHWCLAVSVALLGLCALGVTFLDDPAGARPYRAGRWLRTALGPLARRVLIGLGALLVLACVAVNPRLPDAVSASNPADNAVELIAAAFILITVLTGVLLIPAALIARRCWADHSRELRPWAGGWMAAPTLALAGLLGGGFGAGIGISVRKALGGAAGLRLPPGYEYITLLWGVAGVLIAPIAGGLVLIAAMRRALSDASRRGVPEIVDLLHADRDEDMRKAATAWWLAGLERAHLHHAVLTMTGALSVGAAISVVLRLRGITVPDWADPVVALGVFLLGLLAALLLRAVYLAARRPDSARHLGAIADLACFWPRQTHPVVPPCYALKVVPELAARAAEHLREPNTSVVLTGHSQGSLLVTVAAGQLLGTLSDAERERLGVVIAGSPLQWAYPRAFPAAVPHASLEALARGLDGRWRSLCRGTDPFGGAVLTWERQVCQDELLGVGYRSDGRGPLDAARVSPSGALVLGGDHWLPDPQRAPIAGRRWSPGVHRHTDYPGDPEWDRAVAIAAGLEPPTGTVEQPALFALPQLPDVARTAGEQARRESAGRRPVQHAPWR